MQVTVKADSKNYHYLVLRFLSPIQPYSRLKDRERQVLGLLLHYYYTSKEESPELRFWEIFSPRMRQRIMKDLKLSRASMDNYFSILRKEGFITKDDGGTMRLSKNVLIPLGHSPITFNLNMNG
jgi:hypothetical protein